MTNSNRENWRKRTAFEDESIDVKPWDGLNAEFQNTLSHEFVKWALAAALYEVGHKWDSEVGFPNGREADIVDLGPDDGDPIVYEVETGYTKADVQRKLDHFHIDPVRDVIIIDPADVPSEPEAAVDHLLTHEVIGGQH